MRTTVPVFLLTFALCAGCTGSATAYHHEQPWLDDPRMAQWEELEAQKAEVNRKGVQPQMQEIEGCGTMFVWSHSLSGGPGWEFLRAAYSYRNTSHSNFDLVRVWIEVLDPDGKVVNRKEDIMTNPLGYALVPGATYSDVMRVETLGVHKKKGWSWRIGCEPVQMKVLPPRRVGG